MAGRALGRAGYSRRLAGLCADWRRLRAGDLHRTFFYLGSYGLCVAAAASGWALSAAAAELAGAVCCAAGFWLRAAASALGLCGDLSGLAASFLAAGICDGLRADLDFGQQHPAEPSCAGLGDFALAGRGGRKRAPLSAQRFPVACAGGCAAFARIGLGFTILGSFPPALCVVGRAGHFAAAGDRQLLPGEMAADLASSRRECFGASAAFALVYAGGLDTGRALYQSVFSQGAGLGLAGRIPQ